MFLPINGRDPARGVAGEHDGGRGRRPGERRRAAVRRPSSLRHVYVQHGARGESSRPRRVGSGPGSLLGFFGAANVGRSSGERNPGDRHRDVRDQDARHRRDAGRSSPRPRPSIPATTPGPAGRSKTPSSGGRRPAETVRGVLAKGDVKPADVAGVGLSGQMHGSVFLDGDGRVIRPALLWNDQRTAAECAEIEERAGGREALDPDGRQPGADRLHRPQDPLGPQARARRTGTGSARSSCPRTTSATASPAPTRPRSPTPPAPSCSTSPTADGARSCSGKLDLDPALLPDVLREPRGLGEGQHAGRRRPAWRSSVQSTVAFEPAVIGRPWNAPTSSMCFPIELACTHPGSGSDSPRQ